MCAPRARATASCRPTTASCLDVRAGRRRCRRRCCRAVACRLRGEGIGAGRRRAARCAAVTRRRRDQGGATPRLTAPRSTAPRLRSPRRRPQRRRSATRCWRMRMRSAKRARSTSISPRQPPRRWRCAVPSPAARPAEAGGAAVRVVLKDGSELPRPGRLLFADLSVDATSDQATLHAEVLNLEGLLLPGVRGAGPPRRAPGRAATDRRQRQIAAARAAFFPRISLTGSVGPARPACSMCSMPSARSSPRSRRWCRCRRRGRRTAWPCTRRSAAAGRPTDPERRPRSIRALWSRR